MAAGAEGYVVGESVIEFARKYTSKLERLGRTAGCGDRSWKKLHWIVHHPVISPRGAATPGKP